MAERRMFAKTIIDSDAFLDMPATTQLLYFHLSMRADDDGFINNPKSIMRNARCNDDDLKLLIAKKFIIPFESGIVVIKHWKIHNYIAKDRYTETKYKEEKSTLMLDKNKAYTTCIQPVYEMDTQVRLGKDSLGKVSIEEKSKEKINVRIDYQKVIDCFNETCVSLPSVKTLSESRKKAIKGICKKYSSDEIKEAFKLAESSDFLKGKNDRKWTANFDWIMKDANLAKILDGNYTGHKPVNTAVQGDQTDLDDVF